MSLIETCLVLTRGSEQIEGGTAFPRRGAMTVPDHVLQIALQVPKRDQSLADLGQLVLGQQPRLLARALTLDLQQSSHFVQTKSHRLRPPDDLQSGPFDWPRPEERRAGK